MEMITLGVLALINLLISGVLFYTIKRYNRFNSKRLKEIETAVKDIRVIRQKEYSTPSPNIATAKPKKEEEMIGLDEAQPWSIPDDIKIEVEGGDGFMPPEYQEL